MSLALAPKSRACRPRRALTLTELLVVIAILAILMAILLPAVQRARESSNFTQCANNLHQIGIAAHSVESLTHRFPSGGWGWAWIGMPDRGSGPGQPGSWLYSLLPYVDKGDLHRLGSGEVSPDIEKSMLTLLETPVQTFVCPTRRNGGPYDAQPQYGTYRVGVGPTGETVSLTANVLVRADYAGNAGSQAFNELFAGPDTLAEGDNTSYAWPTTTACSGILFQRSAIAISSIRRGTSNVFFAGERCVASDHYTDGLDIGDNESMYAGFDNDGYRVTIDPPKRDERGVINSRIFGSAHVGALNMLYCDGSVRAITYDIDPDVFFDSGRRD
jgi:prepilin-type N-terminal cleavage/methylation domain-containing protein/prepilin-type processing-associated H-X9-DG protein